MIWLSIIILKSTFFLTIGAALIAAVKVDHVQGTRLFRTACVLVLLQGCCWFHLSVPQSRNSSSPSFIEVDPPHEWIQLEVAQPVEFQPAEKLPVVAEAASTDFRWLTAEQMEPVATGFVTIWLCGIIMLVVRSFANYYRFHRNLELTAVNPGINDAWLDVIHETGIATTDIAVSTNVGPAVMQRGFRSLLVLPADLLDEISTIQLRGILIHEATHIARRDIWKSLAVRILAIVHWFNPCAWVIVRRFDEAAEWACDAKCQSLLSDDITEFAKVILDNVAPASLPSLSLGVRGHCMAVRIRRMLFPERIKESKMRTCLLCIAFIALTTVNAFESVSTTFADDAKNQTPPATLDLPFPPVGSKDTQRPPGVVDLASSGRQSQPSYIDSLREELKELQEHLGMDDHEVFEDTRRKIRLNENGGALWEIEIWECDAGALRHIDNKHSMSVRKSTIAKTVAQISHTTDTPELKVNGSPETGFTEAVLFRRTDASGNEIQPRDAINPLAAPQTHPQPDGNLPLASPDKETVASNAQHAPKAGDGLFFAIDHDDYKVELNKLRKKGTARRKGEPHVYTKFGYPGAVLQGGAVPVVVPAGGNKVAIEFIEFGTSMELMTIRLNKDTLRSEIQFEFAELDDKASVKVGDIVVPGLSVCAASFSIEQKSGETIVIRGCMTSADPGEPTYEMVYLIKPVIQKAEPIRADR